RGREGSPHADFLPADHLALLLRSGYAVKERAHRRQQVNRRDTHVYCRRLTRLPLAGRSEEGLRGRRKNHLLLRLLYGKVPHQGGRGRDTAGGRRSIAGASYKPQDQHGSFEEARNEPAGNARCTHTSPVLVTASAASAIHRRMEGLRISVWRVDMGRGREARTGKGYVHLPAGIGWNGAGPKNPPGLSGDKGAGCFRP